LRQRNQTGLKLQPRRKRLILTIKPALDIQIEPKNRRVAWKTGRS
jgi:hypothetical protein